VNREEILPRLQSALGGKLLSSHLKSPKRLFVEVAPEHIVEVSRLLFKDLGARFQIASGIDQLTMIEILYHWAFDDCNCLLTVRVRLDRKRPEIDSLAPVFKASEWIEREMWELLGIQFRNHPGLTHLLLKEDWPEGQYPLRRDYRKTEYTGKPVDAHE
jgi:NADH-quinone oxidoreductase subunit C